MDTYILDVQNIQGFLTGFAIPAIMYLYANRKGFTFTKQDVIKELNETKDKLETISGNVSPEELGKIILTAVAYSENGYTKLEAQNLGIMIVDAVKSK